MCPVRFLWPAGKRSANQLGDFGLRFSPSLKWASRWEPDKINSNILLGFQFHCGVKSKWSLVLTPISKDFLREGRGEVKGEQWGFGGRLFNSPVIPRLPCKRRSCQSRGAETWNHRWAWHDAREKGLNPLPQQQRDHPQGGSGLSVTECTPPSGFLQKGTAVLPRGTLPGLMPGKKEAGRQGE